jgi:hypothetical protein
MASELTVGARIYRPARRAGEGTGGRMVGGSPSIKDFGDGTFMLRAKPNPARPPHWLVVPWEEEGGRVCVCDEPIPVDWTHFEVLFADVNFVAVSPVAGEQGPGTAFCGAD